MEGEVCDDHEGDDDDGEEHQHHALALETRREEALLFGHQVRLRARGCWERGL